METAISKALLTPEKTGGILRLLSVAILFLFPLTSTADVQKDQKTLVKEYNNLLDETFPNRQGCHASVTGTEIRKLIGLIGKLLAEPISSPEILQKLQFVASYEILLSLERNPPAGLSDTVARWKELLAKLDIKAYQTNRFFDRPSALWVVRKARDIPAVPTQEMREGIIAREERTVWISPGGEPCAGSEKGCEEVRYILLRCLVRGCDDPEMVRERLHSFPPEQANRRVTGYWQVPLEEDTLLMRRNYTMNPLPGYEGTMENYHQMVFHDKQRIIILEENARVGKFVLRTDNAAVYIKSPPDGVTVALLFTGKYLMEGFFRTLVGNKPMEESLKALAIIRQYVEHPDKDVPYAVQAGTEDYRKNQEP